MDEETLVAVDTFAAAARRYCAVIDAAGAREFSHWLEALQTALAGVYQARFLLPDIGPATSDIPNSEIALWEVVFTRLRDYLGEYDVYLTVWDSYDHDNSAIRTHLANDLADIYHDLREGLQLLESGADPADVVWTWREDFNMNWGRHAVDAMKAIHCLRYLHWT